MWSTSRTNRRSTSRWCARRRKELIFHCKMRLNSLLSLSLSCRQDLACGLYELKPKDSAASDGAGPSLAKDDDEEEEDDEKVQLRLPSQQTAAVTRAKKQGRSLIEPLGDEPRSKRKDREGAEDG